MCSLFKRTLAILVSGSHSRRIRLEGSSFSPSLNLYKNSCSSKTYIKYYFFIRVWRELPILLLEFSEDYCSFTVMAITSFIVIIELTTLFLGMVLQLPHTGFGRSHLFPVEITLHLMVGWNGDWFGKEEVLPLKKAISTFSNDVFIKNGLDFCWYTLVNTWYLYLLSIFFFTSAHKANILWKQNKTDS